MKKIESEPMSEYVIKIKEITNSLAIARDLINNRDKICIWGKTKIFLNYS